MHADNRPPPTPLPKPPAFHTALPVRLPRLLAPHRPPATFSSSTFTPPILPQRPRLASIPRRRATTPTLSASSDRMLWATNISKTHDGRITLLQNTSLVVHRGEKIAILGANGCGKSTLLSILTGELPPDAGDVSLRKGASCALVAQSLPEDLDATYSTTTAVLALAARFAPSPAVSAARRHAAAAADAAATDSAADVAVAAPDAHAEALHALASATADMERHPDAWQLASRVATAMSKLDLPPDARLSELSGGQRRRVAIAAAIACRPDVLLLDEVTNHLSVDAIQFLEAMLADPALTVVCISHDRYFVDAVCTSAIYDLSDGVLTRFPPGYADYLQGKHDMAAQATRDDARRRKALVREMEWLRRQPKARGTKSKARSQDARKLQAEVERRSAQARRSDRVRSLKATTARLGGNVLTLNKATVKRGDTTVVREMDYVFERGERVGVCGGNGAGKSSFLHALLGTLPLVDGERVVGDTVVFGHFEQEGIDLSRPLSEASAAVLGTSDGAQLRVADYVSELVSQYGTGSASGGGGGGGVAKAADAGGDVEARLDQQLAELSYSVTMPRSSRTTDVYNPLATMSPVAIMDHFGFSRDKQHAFVKSLSGGERCRLQLMALFLQNPNFLLLDEVSNDLDVDTLTMLEEVLLEYSGVLVLCSHDRFMLDRLVDHLIVIEGNGDVTLVEGKFTDYLAREKERQEAEKQSRKATSAAAKSGSDFQHGVGDKSQNATSTTLATKKRLRPSYKELREYEGLEAEIDKHQQECDELNKRLESEAMSAGYTQIAEWSERLAMLEAEVERKTERWLELAELCDSS